MIVEMTGKRFGRWYVVSRAYPIVNNKFAYWNCVCDCGKEKVVLGTTLRNGRSKSCSCLRGEHQRVHGCAISGKIHPEYRVWMGMRRRCSNPKHWAWKYYGGRGITVCKRWDSFVNFFSDLGCRPTPKHQLERINNSGNYEPSNCKWATRKEEMRNTRQNHLLTFNEQTLCVKEWSEKTGLRYTTLLGRIQDGWSVSAALSLPKQTLTRDSSGRYRKIKTRSDAAAV